MAVQVIPRQTKGTLATALIVTRRELRDSLRDWRIITPTIILTLVFPFIMDFTSRWATNWVSQFTDVLLVERMNPFLLMIVGFFPISFSLVVALESFVGEKERNSIEPILSMPLSDLELYLGKMLSSLTLPLIASYIGISVFLVSRFTIAPYWVPSLELTILMFSLTTVEALVMVSGAVVISSQTTSVRAANLLASFIIIPMALLIQAESVVMFYAEYRALWYFVAALLVINLILVRMGVRIFNREEILAKEMDELHIKTIWRDFKGYFLRPADYALQRSSQETFRFNLLRFYRYDIPLLFKEQIPAFGVVFIATLVAIVLGAIFAYRFPLPQGLFDLNQVSESSFENIGRIQFLPDISTLSIFLNNARVLVLAGIISVFSFGALSLLLTVLNMGLVSFVITQIVLLGFNPWLFGATFVLPHGILEIPALLIGMTFAVRIGASLISPPHGLDIGQSLLLTSANFLKILLFVVLPLLLIAAFIEANVTPQIVLAVYGGG